MISRQRLAEAVSMVIIVIVIGAGLLATQLPAMGAGALLFATRRDSGRPMPPSCIERQFAGAHGPLSGWQCDTPAVPARGTIIYLHGIADDRGSAYGVVTRFLPAGFNVIAYDSRAHGRSSGDLCTYGYFEKDDLKRVIAQIAADPIVLIGHSLGAAVALQTAAVEPRIRAIVAASTFADLRSIATERAPFVFSQRMIDAAFSIAEKRAKFVVDDVSPVRAATNVRAPVFLIHGANDRETPPVHSERVMQALSGAKRLLIVPDASHNDVLWHDAVWAEIRQWIVAQVLVAS
jgi:pimeloyl-ACP methyl ester carboxylesterase